MTNTQEFFRRASKDEALQLELSKALEGKQGEEALRAICDIADSYGFSLSMEGAAAAATELGSESAENTELSDAELEGAAGGVSSTSRPVMAKSRM